MPALIETYYKVNIYTFYIFLNKLNERSYQHYYHYLTSKSDPAPSDKSNKIVCSFPGPHWCNKKVDPEDMFHMVHIKKSRIRDTKYLSTDADSSTDTTVGWTKNTQKPNFFEKREKSSKMQKLKNV